MIRTQISLTEEQKRRLDRETLATGLSMSELLRRLIDEHLPKREYSREEFLAALDAAQGAWKDRDFDGEEYVARMRTGRRLRELYG